MQRDALCDVTSGLRGAVEGCNDPLGTTLAASGKVSYDYWEPFDARLRHSFLNSLNYCLNDFVLRVKGLVSENGVYYEF